MADPISIKDSDSTLNLYSMRIKMLMTESVAMKQEEDNLNVNTWK